MERDKKEKGIRKGKMPGKERKKNPVRDAQIIVMWKTRTK